MDELTKTEGEKLKLKSDIADAERTVQFLQESTDSAKEKLEKKKKEYSEKFPEPILVSSSSPKSSEQTELPLKA